ncbi:MAG: folylpolyglutamate synthase/dihydrofolate synthase family protein [Anaerolineae bacterium]|nr:folylpolyglutamate synthase/dihydrofolate synthase family protein [Anaerolineae bacterium]
MPIESYHDALTYLYSYTNFNPADASNWSLERMQGLLARLGNPHQTFPSLLIAGTKGKGSTAAIADSIFRQAGLKTGLYTSPHLHSFRERIRVAGELITEATLIELVNRLRPAFEVTPGLSAFELITALAFVTFAEAEIEVAVLEVGLGGRLDATNVVEPEVAVITSISYDHTQILGETLTLIASEKAGIIRPGAVVISAPQADEAMRMIETVCREQQAELIVIEREWVWEKHSSDLSGESFTFNGQRYRVPLIGEHQIVNAVTAMTAVASYARRTGVDIPRAAVRAGVEQVVWRGRMEILHQAPYVIVDSAMNGDSAEKLVQALNHYFPGQKITFIYGASADHPVGDMLTTLLPAAERMLMVSSGHPRAAGPDDLVGQAAALGGAAEAAANVAEALRKAVDTANPNQVICVTGSLYLAAPAREAWLRQHDLPLPPIDPLVY